MGLFDSIAGNLLGSALGGQNNGAIGKIIGQLMSGQHGDLGSMLSSMLNEAGGLPGIVSKAQQAGLGNVVGSWVGTGQNAPIDPAQLTNLLGSDAIRGVASRFGVEANDMTPLIASVLPQLIDKLTPQGEVSADQHQGDALTGAINGVLQGGGMSSLLGGLFGGR